MVNNFRRTISIKTLYIVSGLYIFKYHHNKNNLGQKKKKRDVGAVVAWVRPPAVKTECEVRDKLAVGTYRS